MKSDVIHCAWVYSPQAIGFGLRQRLSVKTISLRFIFLCGQILAVGVFGQETRTTPIDSPRHSSTVSNAPASQFGTRHSLLGQVDAALDDDNYHRARDLMEQVHEIEVALFGGDHWKTMESLERLVAISGWLDDFSRAIRTQERLVKLCQHAHGENSWQSTAAGDTLHRMQWRAACGRGDRQALVQADALQRHASQQFAAGQILTATTNLETCLSDWQRITGTDPHPAISNSAVTLSQCYAELGRYQDAIASAQNAFAEAQRLYPSDRYPLGHPDLARCHCALSALQTIVGNHEAAHDAAASAVAICRRLYKQGAQPTGDRVKAMSLRMLVGTSLSMGQGGDSQQLLDECQRLVGQLYPEREFPTGHQEVAVTLDSVGAFYARRSQYENSLTHHQKALAMRVRLYPADRFPRGHRRLASNLSRIATVLAFQNRYEEADEYHQRSLTMYRELHPPDEFPDGHIDLSRQLASLAKLALARGNVQRAGQLARQSLEMAEALNSREGHHHTEDLLRGHEQLGKVLRQEGKHESARAHYLQALKFAKQLYPVSTFPQGHPRLFDCYNSMGVLAWHQQKYSQAAEDFGQALAAAANLGESISPLKRVIARQNLATLLYAQQHLTRATEEFEESLRTLRELFPEERYPSGHVQLATTLMNLGATRSALGDYYLAAQQFEEAAGMLARLFPPDKSERGHPQHFLSLVNLGSSLCQLGEYGEARICLEKALEAGNRLYPRKTYPDGHEQLIGVFNNLSVVMEHLGEHARSLEYSVEALAICRALYSLVQFPDGHPEIARQLQHVGDSYHSLGKTTRAFKFLTESLAMRRIVYADDADYPNGHPLIASSLKALAKKFLAEGTPRAARRCALESISIFEQLAASDSAIPDPGLVAALETAGSIETSAGNYDAAIAHLERALAALQVLHPSTQTSAGHPELAGTLGRAAAAYHAAGRLHDARRALGRANAINRESAERLLPMLSEAEGLNYLASQPRIANRLLTIAAALNEPPETVYREIWSARGAVQRAISTRRRELLQVEDQKSRRRYQLWLDRKRQIAQLTIAGSPDDDAETFQARRVRLEQLTTEKEKLERELAGLLPRTEYSTAASNPVAAMRRGLPVDAAFVDIRLYTRFAFARSGSSHQETRTNCYVAFIQSRDVPVVRVELGPIQAIDDVIRDWRRSIATRETESFRQMSEWLHRTVWSPIEAKLPESVETLFICPDGALTGLPWAALPGEETGSVLLERFAFAQVPYGEFLLDQFRIPNTQTLPAPLLVVGNVDYERSPASAAPRHSHYVLRAPMTTEQRPAWSALPATKIEARRVADFATSTGPAIVLSGEQASTENVLTELCRARRAHFATHGFFADAHFRSMFQLDPALFEERSRLLRAERTRIAGRNPLVLSGLVLAGANRRPTVSELNLPLGDGGILTAETISGLELPELDLVTLSACDTGLGDVAGREGVFGLQRAFHVAGAKTVVASLWKVDDEATQELMIAFYENLYDKKLSKLQALRQAQLAVRGKLRAGQLARGLVRDRVPSSKSTAADAAAETLLWASWTLSGDWK